MAIWTNPNGGSGGSGSINISGFATTGYVDSNIQMVNVTISGITGVDTTSLSYINTISGNLNNNIINTIAISATTIDANIKTNLNTLNIATVSGGVDYLSSTKLISGGDLSGDIGSTVFNISAGYGTIISHNINTGIPTKVTVSWNNINNISVSASISSGYSATFILMDSTGSPVLSVMEPVESDIRNYIYLGKVSHRFGTINNIRSYKRTGIELFANISDLNDALGPFNVSGNVFSNVGTNLQIKKSSGKSYRFSSNYINDAKSPNLSTDAALNPVTFRPVYRTDSNGNTVTYGNSTTNIDPTKYDDGSGTLQTVSNNKYTLQRIYYFPVTGSVYIFYGQAAYASAIDAKSGIITETFKLNDPSFTDAILRGYLIIRQDVTDLSSTNAIFIESSKFGATSSSGGVTTSVYAFGDNQFQIYDEANLTHTLNYDLNSVTGGTKNYTIKVPDISAGTVVATLPISGGILATKDDISNQYAFKSYSTSAGLNVNTMMALYTGTGGDTFTLPPANSNTPNCVRLIVKHYGSGVLSVSPNTGEFIEDKSVNTAITMNPQQSLTFVSDVNNHYYLV